MKTTARFDPRASQRAKEPLELTGMAFAGARGVQRVEISLDGGRNWLPCEMVTATRPPVWSLWHYTWRTPTPGRYTLLVRATDGTGAPQIADRHGRWPSGAAGYDRLRLEVRV